MAALRIHQVSQLQRLFGSLELRAGILASQQVRFRNQKKARVRAPHEGQQKDKWVSRSQSLNLVKVKRTMPEAFLNKVAIDDVWIRTYYPRPTHGFEDGLHMHRELLQPDMLDREDAMVLLHLTLDFKTKKKTKFMNSISKTILPPHKFEDGLERRVVAFCKNPEEIEMAKSMGAAFAGGPELIKSFEKNEITKNDFDFVICTQEILPQLMPLRAYMKDLFPNKAKDNLGTDLKAMLELFISGKTYASEKESESVGKMSVAIGRLNMPIEQLIENKNTFITSICSNRSRDLGPFITKASLECPPSSERFLMHEQEVNIWPARERPKPRRQAKDQEELMAATA